jgi:hypothetical protein
MIPAVLRVMPAVFIDDSGRRGHDSSGDRA